MSAPTTPSTVNRRDFLKLTGLAGGGFALAFQIRPARGGAAPAGGDFRPNAFSRTASLAGTSRVAAVAARAPYPSFFPAVCTTVPSIARHSAAGTFQVRAAASTSIVRTVAPSRWNWS